MTEQHTNFCNFLQTLRGVSNMFMRCSETCFVMMPCKCGSKQRLKSQPYGCKKLASAGNVVVLCRYQGNPFLAIVSSYFVAFEHHCPCLNLFVNYHFNGFENRFYIK